VDGVIPDCQTAIGCLLPELDKKNRRLLEIRSMLVRLHGLVDPGTICKMMEVDRDELEILATIEEHLREDRERGQGHQADYRRGYEEG